jgi:hypothetical protein
MEQVPQPKGPWRITTAFKKVFKRARLKVNWQPEVWVKEREAL